MVRHIGIDSGHPWPSGLRPVGRADAQICYPANLSNREGSQTSLSFRHKKRDFVPCLAPGGEGGIRTLDRGLAYTPLAGERLQPLGHLSGFIFVVIQLLAPAFSAIFQVQKGNRSIFRLR